MDEWFPHGDWERVVLQSFAPGGGSMPNIVLLNGEALARIAAHA
jgi:formiminotetrahydrofolate cyclodeaminase